MKAHYIVKNGKRETGEMSVFEAVEVLEKFRSEGTESDRFEIHSFCRNWGIKKQGQKSFQSVLCGFKTMEHALAYAHTHFAFFDVVEVREFMIWYRIHDDKDFKLFYTDTPDLADAVDEAIRHLNGVVFAIDYDGDVVSRYGENFIRNPEKKR